MKKRSNEVDPDFNWHKIAYFSLCSRSMDHLEETELLPARKLLYQFSARGHDVPQIMLGSLLTHSHDAVSAYYRSRPMLLALGLTMEDAMGGPMMKSGGYSGGRDIGVVCNIPKAAGAVVLPMSGSVGSQYTPAVGWAQAITYRRDQLGEKGWQGALACSLGGDGSVASNGFWAALTIATTLELPMLFYIEDNGYGISVPSTMQTPGGDIARNLASFGNLEILSGDGANIANSASLIKSAVAHVRAAKGPCLLRLTVPRLSGHSGQDNQAYKCAEMIADERDRDPLPKLHDYLVPRFMSSSDWSSLANEAESDVRSALACAEARAEPVPEGVLRHIFEEKSDDGGPDLQLAGGIAPEGFRPSAGDPLARPQGPRINMAVAIRRTLETELAENKRLLVFGEDVGAKGGVHTVTMGLMDRFGQGRVFDTSLSEEGIIGRAVGMALAGLMPVPEIQFRKYADPCAEQLNDCGTIRWRTNNRWAAPMVVRIPGGFFKCGDPWHSQCSEVTWLHAIGWQLVFPSNAEDAAGLLRQALRENNPTIFFEHRSLLDGSWARRPWPGDDFVVPFGVAKKLLEGDQLTVVTWGAMVERCVKAAETIEASIEILDLRSLMPWDKQAILDSVRKTSRCLIVHEDTHTAGFGAEISATLGKEAFFHLDAPVERLTMPDIPSPHNPALLNAVVPSVADIADKMMEILEF